MSKYHILRFPGFLERALTLSYDDGVVFDRRLMEILDAHGMKCTFNLNSECFAEQPDGRRLTKEEAVALYRDTHHEIAVHGARHRMPVGLRPEELLREVLTDRENLEAMFGRVVKGMAYAYGGYNDEVVRLLKECGIDYSRTVVSTEKFDIPTDWLRMPATCHHRNSHLFELADAFLATDTSRPWDSAPKLFYLWGHSYEFNDSDNWDVIERFAEKLGNRDDVWYVTNGEIYAYVQAFDRLRFSADGVRVENPSALDVYLCVHGKNVVCPAGGSAILTE